MSRYNVLDAGSDNNNCMILSAIAGAPHVFGVTNKAEAVAKAREIRAQIAAMMRSAIDPGTKEDIKQAGRDVCAAIDVLRGWKERTREDSCPSADYVMCRKGPIGESATLITLADFLSRNEMLGFVELTFLKVICDRLGIRLVALTNDSSRLTRETERWVDVQRQQAEASGKVPVVIMTDSVHYRAVGRFRGRTPKPDSPKPMTVCKKRKVEPCPCLQRTTSITYTDICILAFGIVCALLFAKGIKPSKY